MTTLTQGSIYLSIWPILLLLMIRLSYWIYLVILTNSHPQRFIRIGVYRILKTDLVNIRSTDWWHLVVFLSCRLAQHVMYHSQLSHWYDEISFPNFTVFSLGVIMTFIYHHRHHWGYYCVSLWSWFLLDLLGLRGSRWHS